MAELASRIFDVLSRADKPLSRKAIVHLLGMDQGEYCRQTEYNEPREALAKLVAKGVARRTGQNGTEYLLVGQDTGRKARPKKVDTRATQRLKEQNRALKKEIAGLRRQEKRAAKERETDALRKARKQQAEASRALRKARKKLQQPAKAPAPATPLRRYMLIALCADVEWGRVALTPPSPHFAVLITDRAFRNAARRNATSTRIPAYAGYAHPHGFGDPKDR